MQNMQELLQLLDKTYGASVAEPIKNTAQKLHEEIKQCNFDQWLNRPLNDHANDEFGTKIPNISPLNVKTTQNEEEKEQLNDELDEFMECETNLEQQDGEEQEQYVKRLKANILTEKHTKKKTSWITSQEHY